MKHSVHVFLSVARALAQLLHRHGMLLLTAACIGTIVLSAVWQGRRDGSVTLMQPGAAAQARDASAPLQQSLQDASTFPPASPSPAPQSRLCAPLSSMQVIVPFSGDAMVYNSLTRVYALHEAVDLSCPPGEPVYAAAAGVITAIDEKGTGALRLTLDCGDHLTLCYAGLESLDGMQVGQRVNPGDVLGLSGAGPLDESHLGAHLHLSAYSSGCPIDPMTLFPALP